MNFTPFEKTEDNESEKIVHFSGTFDQETMTFTGEATLDKVAGTYTLTIGDEHEEQEIDVTET